MVLAAGRGDRLGASVPKAHVRLGAHSILARSALALAEAPRVAAVLPVVAAGAGPWIEELRAVWPGSARLLREVRGGASRQESVWCGLAALQVQAPELEWVLVHDAARCLVVPQDAEDVLEAARETGAAIPVVPVTDTLKEVAEGRVRTTVDRSRLARALTPQAFRVELLRSALERAHREGFVGTDCASLVERLGGVVRVCAGREENLKLTTPADLERLRARLEREEPDAGPRPLPGRSREACR